MREIVLDTETTGLNPRQGDRIVEIGCVELVNHVPTGNEYHCYINPERDMPDAAYQVHGLSEAFLSDKPVFADICDDFLDFIGNAPLVIHNASFDMGFLNAELELLNRDILLPERAVDTLVIARGKFPGSPASLDALCRRFGIDTTVRDKHGALIDSLLLARVYLELIGGEQPGLQLVAKRQENGLQKSVSAVRRHGPRPRPLPSALTAEEYAAHQDFVARELGDEACWVTPQ